jgi:hypothetical protein
MLGPEVKFALLDTRTRGDHRAMAGGMGGADDGPATGRVRVLTLNLLSPSTPTGSGAGRC